MALIRFDQTADMGPVWVNPVHIEAVRPYPDEQRRKGAWVMWPTQIVCTMATYTVIEPIALVVGSIHEAFDDIHNQRTGK